MESTPVENEDPVTSSAELEASGDSFGSTVQRYPFFILWALSILGYWSVLPYISYLGLIPEEISFLSFFLFGTLQVAILNGILLLIGYIFLKRIDLDPFKTGNWLQQTVLPAVVVGLVLGFGLHYLDALLFSSFNSHLPSLPRWAGALSSLYGAINEEILARIFLLPMFYWVLSLIFKGEPWTRNKLMGAAISLSALTFAIGHLPAGVAIGLVTFVDILRILILNILAGVAFGWLFFRNGFWAASLAHLITDIILHAVY